VIKLKRKNLMEDKKTKRGCVDVFYVEEMGKMLRDE
jgi:hypothetical protein